MNVIEKVREILQSFPKISEICSEIHVDFADPEPTSYGLSSIGDSLVREDILGNQLRQHTFILYSTFSAYNDYERMNNSTALLELSYWLESHKDSGIETKIGNKTFAGNITKLTAENGMLYSVPQDNLADGVQYQLQIIAEYTVEKF